MPGYAVLFSNLARDKFDRLIASNRKLGEQIAKAFDRIAAHPEIGQLMKGVEWEGCRKYRSGDYRIIYRIERSKLIIYILTLGNRKNIYQ